MTPPMADMDKDCMGYALCPDAMTDEKKAMASVNGKMVVKSSHDAILTPMWLDPAPNGVGVTGGMDNMPFANVDWKAMQSEVVGMGVTFRATRVRVGVGGGAGQEEVPESEVMHITCGPFACSEASMAKPAAPEISAANSAVCAAWDPDLELQVGMIDNDIYEVSTSARGVGNLSIMQGDSFYDNGIDVGWLSSSHVEMAVKHIFSGEGSQYSVMGPDAAKGTSKPLAVSLADNSLWDPGIEWRKLETEDQYHRVEIDTLSEACFPATSTTTSAGYALMAYGGVKRGDVHRPDECFRVRAVLNGGLSGAGVLGPEKVVNYLEGYRVEVSPKDSMAWGKVAWKTGPLKDLKCAPVSFAAADQVDVCELFEEEVDHALATGWGNVLLRVRDRAGASVSDSTATSINAQDGGHILNTLEVGFKGWDKATPEFPKPRRFKRLFFDDNLNGKLIDGPDEPLYGVVSGRFPTASWKNLDYVTIDTHSRKKSRILHNVYGYTEFKGVTTRDLDEWYLVNIYFIWKSLMDGDEDPTMGDFGKVDLYNGTATTDTAKAKPDNKADNYPSTDDAHMCSDADGKGCDASWEMDYDILFSDGIYGCETTRTATISCEWDAQGLMKANPPDTINGNLAATGNVANFAKCVAK